MSVKRTDIILCGLLGSELFGSFALWVATGNDWVIVVGMAFFTVSVAAYTIVTVARERKGNR